MRIFLMNLILISSLYSNVSYSETFIQRNDNNESTEKFYIDGYIEGYSDGKEDSNLEEVWEAGYKVGGCDILFRLKSTIEEGIFQKETKRLDCDK